MMAAVPLEARNFPGWSDKHRIPGEAPRALPSLWLRGFSVDEILEQQRAGSDHPFDVGKIAGLEKTGHYDIRGNIGKGIVKNGCETDQSTTYGDRMYIAFVQRR